MTQPAPSTIRRDLEIEEPTNRFFIHPIAARLAVWCAAKGIKPNTVSITGMAFGILAGVFYYHYRDAGAAMIGFGLMIGWHIMDGADGQLARLTHAQSELGKVLDGICDYVTFIAVYAALGIAMARQDGASVILVVMVSGTCHAAQSAAYEAQRQDYIYWAWGRGAKPSSIDPGQKALGTIGKLLDLYARLQRLLGSNADFNRALASVNPTESFRARYRDRFAPALRQWSILSANYRTLGIFICAFLGIPLLYFFFEIIGFSLILVLLAKRQTARSAGFIAEIGA